MRVYPSICQEIILFYHTCRENILYVVNRDMTKSEIKFMRFVALERFPMDLQFHVVRSVAWEFIQIESNQNIPEIIADIAVVVVA